MFLSKKRKMLWKAGIFFGIVTAGVCYLARQPWISGEENVTKLYSGLSPDETVESSEQNNESLSGETDRIAQENDSLSGRTDRFEKEDAGIPGTEEKIWVYVCGEVSKPGVYELSRDARVQDAILIAGGMTENAAGEYLNLARRVEDEERIYVCSQEEMEQRIAEGRDASGSFFEENSNPALGSEEKEEAGNHKVNINSASESVLMTLPGIGQTKARAIVEYRLEHGDFQSIRELTFVPGIKEGIYQKLEEYITVTGK